MNNISMDIEDINFYKNKINIYKYLIENEPCWWNDRHDCWVITRYDDVINILKDHDNFTTEFGVSLKTRIPYDQHKKRRRYNEQNNTDYKPNRAIIVKTFQNFMQPELENYIDEIISIKVKDSIGVGSFDIVSEILYPAPIEIICKALGINKEAADKAIKWSSKYSNINDEKSEEEILDNLTRIFINDIPENIELYNSQNKYHKYLNRKEKALYSVIFMVAGHSSVTSSMGNLIYNIFNYPEQFELIKQNKDFINNFVEESLRFSSTNQGVLRTCTRDYVLHNKVIKEGDSVLVSINAANLDPSKWGNDSYVFSINRSFPSHNIVFGYGSHQCVGLKLARLEIKKLLENLTSLSSMKLDNLILKNKADLLGTPWEKIFVTLE